MPVYTFTADFLSRLRGHILVHHTRTSEHIRCATAFCSCLRQAGPPAPCWPACALRAHSAFESSTFVAATRNTWSRTNKCIIMLAATGPSSTGLAKSGLLVGSSRAIGSYVVWATNLHLNVVARGRVPEIDHLYPPSWGCLDGQVQLLFCYWRECAVMMLKSLHKLKHLYFSHSAFKRSTIIYWRASKLKLCSRAKINISRVFMDFPQCDITLCSLDWLLWFTFEPTNSDTHVYWEPSFSKTMSNENS
jgi:hypothetical protein